MQERQRAQAQPASSCQYYRRRGPTTTNSTSSFRRSFHHHRSSVYRDNYQHHQSLDSSSSSSHNDSCCSGSGDPQKKPSPQQPRDVFNCLLNREYDKYDQASLNLAIFVNTLDNGNVVMGGNSDPMEDLAVTSLLMLEGEEEEVEAEVTEDYDYETARSDSEFYVENSVGADEEEGSTAKSAAVHSRSRSNSGGSVMPSSTLVKRKLLNQQIRGLYLQLFMGKDVYAEVEASNAFCRGKYADNYFFCIDEYNIIRPQRKPTQYRSYGAVQSKNNNNSNNEGALCTICFDNPKDILFVNCGHVSMCQICLFDMIKTSLDKDGQFYQSCPSCRTPITKCLDVIIH